MIQIQSRLLRMAGIFLFLNALILTLAPAVRERSWDVDYRLSHWIGFLAWVIFTTITRRAVSHRLPESDPYLLPAAALLSGWGMLTIWRLDESFGIRQTVWMCLSALVFAAALYIPKNLNFLRKYKYILLTGGLFITALTLLLGTNPLGVGPRLWLGCCGIYLQPSEPLKLLLVIYLSAYLADRLPVQVFSRSALLIPTIAVTGLALLLLLVQRDLGTASIFVSIFTIILFITTGKRRVLLSAGVFLSIALGLGYFFISVIQVRVDGWLNPWNDPSGNSFQIIQSLLAVANGGIFGRGLGIGSPLLVPVAISDFIFAAIAEENGLIGALGLLLLIGIILMRGITAALNAPDRFRRYLAAGISTYLGVQSLLIIGGNLRLLPLTGVTLPFVSYGGSSLLTSYIALLILLVISNRGDDEPAPLPNPQPYTILAALLALGLFASALSAAWWAFYRAPDLLARTDNPRRAIADRYVQRGALLDRNNQPIHITQGESGTYTRVYQYPDLAPITGYTHPVYGQSGLEFTLDAYLRGLAGNPASRIWLDHFLYGTPPPGLDVRLSLSLALQSKADELLGSHTGALVVMNAQTGEILAMSSHPTFDANKLDEIGDTLAQDKSSPLINRAAQGVYPIQGLLPAMLNSKQSDANLREEYQKLGLFQAPALNMPLSFNSSPNRLSASPLQIGLIASVVSNEGIKPAPRIALAIHTPLQGWVTLAQRSQPSQAIPTAQANQAASNLMVEGKPYWRHGIVIKEGATTVTWLAAGTPPNWSGAPLAIVILLEENNLPLAQRIADEMFNAAISQ